MVSSLPPGGGRGVSLLLALLLLLMVFVFHDVCAGERENNIGLNFTGGSESGERLWGIESLKRGQGKRWI